jgi:mannose-6-phosphate isomerase-like protein (cupin superfamily)
MGKGWQVATIEEVPANPPTDDPAFWSEWTDDREFGTGWHSLREHFGIHAFGVNANTAAAGRELVAEHEETQFAAHEELYVVVRGRARFECDGSDLEIAQGQALHVAPEVRRRAVALETPTVLLMVGGVPARPYEAPDWGRGGLPSG